MIEVYATGENGEGYVQSLGSYESTDDIRIYTSVLGPNVLITFFDDYEGDKTTETEMEDMRRTGGPG